MTSFEEVGVVVTETSFPIRRGFVAMTAVSWVGIGFYSAVAAGSEWWGIPGPARPFVHACMAVLCAWEAFDALVVLLRRSPGLVITPTHLVVGTSRRIREVDWTAVEDVSVGRFYPWSVRVRLRSGRPVWVQCAFLDGGFSPVDLAAAIAAHGRQLVAAAQSRWN